MSASKNLGKVFMTPKGIWDKNSNYTKLDIVTNKIGKISCGYIATTDIEKNIEITDNRWLKLFELLDGDLTEEYKAVQTDVANKATDVDTNKKAVDLIYSQMQKLYDVEISTTTPTNERTGLWINPDDISGVINIPEIKDDEVSDVDTWSSKKIDKETGSLKEDLSNKITKFYASSQSETHLADSDNGKIMDMMLYGKSEQKQYSGDNIYYMDYEDYSQTYNGARITSTKFGYSVSGTISGAGGYTLTNRYITLAPGTYKMLLKNISALKIGLSKRDYSVIATISEGKTDTTFTLDEETEVCLTIRYSNTTSNETNEIMLTKNLEATSYEPYVGGQPSPSPDYPQEIKSVVNPTVKVCGKNLLNPTLFKDYLLTTHGVTCKSVTDETGSYFLLDGTADSEIDFWIQDNTVFTYDGSADKLTISVREACPDSYYLCVGILERDFRNTKAVTTSLKSFSFYIHVLKGAVINNYRIYAQVEVGDIATDYEPYTEQTVTLPYTLNAIPVESGGNVTIDGQQYIADYVDVERGKRIKMVGEVDLGSLDWTYMTRYTAFAANVSGKADGQNMLCSMYINYGTANLSSMPDMYICANGRGEQFFIKNSKYTDADAFKQAMSGAMLYYELATPEEIDLTTEEIKAFELLQTYYPTTNISVNSEQLDGYTIFNYPISMENGWNYVKQQIGDTRDYIYDMDARAQDTDLQAAEAYVNSEYAVALTELEV
jgi:hypothetical protein